MIKGYRIKVMRMGPGLFSGVSSWWWYCYYCRCGFPCSTWEGAMKYADLHRQKSHGLR